MTSGVSVESSLKIDKVKHLLPKESFVITKEIVDVLKKETGEHDIVEIGRLVCFARSMSATVSPISHFAAGAVVIGVSESMYIGFNIEYMHTPLGETIHAEQCAISSAVNHGEEYIQHIITSPTPCGHCRQFMRECKNAEGITVHSCSKETTEFLFHLPLFELLPYSFGPVDLGCKRGIFDANDKTFSIPTRLDSLSDENNDVVNAALSAIKRSHSPHTQSWCSVALIWTNNDSKQISTGIYLENAAYNPSLGALQSALISLLTSGGSFDNIEAVYVFEDTAAQVKHLSKSELLLNQIAPDALLFLQPLHIS